MHALWRSSRTPLRGHEGETGEAIGVGSGCAQGKRACNLRRPLARGHRPFVRFGRRPKSTIRRRRQRRVEHHDRLVNALFPAGPVAIVTGAGKGIGRASALALAQAGADVALAARARAPTWTRWPTRCARSAPRAAAGLRRQRRCRAPSAWCTPTLSNSAASTILGQQRRRRRAQRTRAACRRRTSRRC